MEGFTRHLAMIAMATLGRWEIILIAAACLWAVFWIRMIVDCAKHEKSDNKILWLLVVVIGGIFGAVVYYFARKFPRYFVRR